MNPLAAMARKRSSTVEQIRSERQAAREAVEASKRAAAAKRAEIRRLARELFPPEAAPAPLSIDEQLEALRAAAAAKKSGDTRPTKTLIAEADAAVREKRPPRER